MIEAILSINWMSVLLALFTAILVTSDRAFSKRVRVFYVFTLGYCVILSLVGQYIYIRNLGPGNSLYWPLLMLEAFLRPLVLLKLVYISNVISGKKTSFILILPMIINVLCFVLNFSIGNVIAFFVYIFIFSYIVYVSSRKGDVIGYILAFFLFVILNVSVFTEMFMRDYSILNSALCVICSTYYFYLIMHIYKRDDLTGLLIRHDLGHEMQDLLNKPYDLVVIDVDNFKLINDKYGHDRGDEVLVTIVDTVQNNLPAKCKMYRYGGDEFIIISPKVKREMLVLALEQANDELEKGDLHISYGIVKHEPGQESSIAITEADKVMYENKRLLKSEDIWDDRTGLFNYRGFLDEMDTVRKTAEYNKQILCLVGVDVERLSSINLAYGYTEGNRVIAALARVLKNSLRGRDFIGHLGSDEFVVAIECSGEDDEYVTEFIEKIQEGMDSAYEFADTDYSIRLNVGRYFVDVKNPSSSEEMVNNVLYIKSEDKDNRRKNDNSDNGQDYNSQDEETVLDILDNNKLRYAFQPIVSAKDGSIVAYEALMRSDSENMVSPLKILKYAEKNKRSYDIEKYSLFNVLGQLANENILPDGRRIFINSLPGFFLNDIDYDLLKKKYGNLFDRLVLEITEQREIEETALVSLNTRREKDGFNLAIDDYGSGCSNTNSLLRYMPQIIKLDRLLITGIDRNAKKQFFVNSIISFARENDMLILAEGVETESELKTVIRLGADMIQGYVTARPEFEMIDEISDNIKKIIIDENLRVGTNQRMIYTASSNGEISVVHLAMEDYTKVNVSAEYITFTGNAEYTADMVIKVKDGINSHITLSDVRLNSVDDEPCIDIGENSNVILNLEGNNRLNSKGIHVPDSSTLTIIGTGNIEIYVKGHNCYAIGADSESGFGHLMLKSSGCIDINVDGELCVGIGGGVCSSNSKIDVTAGNIIMVVAGVDAVGIGCHRGDIDILLADCNIDMNFRVNAGTAIGSLNGTQNICIKNFKINLSGSGTEISGLGSINESAGMIKINSGTYLSKMNGHIVNLIGAKSGKLAIEVEHARVDLMGEGDIVMGMGSTDYTSEVIINECTFSLVINASSPLGFGADVNEIKNIGSVSKQIINGVEVDFASQD